MIIVADSGSTITDWIIVHETKTVGTFQTIGLNPYFTESETITRELRSKFPTDFDQNKIEKIYFYGSGCTSEKMNSVIHNGIIQFFPEATIKIESDLLAAARALFQNEEGIAAILGTGSNTCFYNGTEITKNVSSLGYILGNEGSGDYLGKLFIMDYLNKELPNDISNIFYSKFGFTKNDILQKVYREPNPNRFLASFCFYIKEISYHPHINNLIKRSFTDFFTKHICKYENYTDYKIRITGSIGYYFRNQLLEVADKFDAKIDSIEISPMEKLVKYHT